MTRTTHTYAELEVSPEAYDEIRSKLEAAGYTHAFMEDGAIDMHGIGLIRGRPHGSLEFFHRDAAGNVNFGGFGSEKGVRALAEQRAAQEKDHP